MWRKPDNSLAAVEDACWHRLAPLSLGWLENGEVVCKYHGTEVRRRRRAARTCPPRKVSPGAGCAGLSRRWTAIVSSGSGPAIPRRPIRARARHALERRPGWTGDGKTMFAKCDYRLFVDNLMDLTHETFVHSTSIGNSAVAETPMETSHDGEQRHRPAFHGDIEPPPFWRAQLGKPGQRRPVADHPLRAAMHHRARRRRCADGNRRAAGRPFAGRQPARAQHDLAARPKQPACISGRSCAITGSTTPRSPPCSARRTQRYSWRISIVSRRSRSASSHAAHAAAHARISTPAPSARASIIERMIGEETEPAG